MAETVLELNGDLRAELRAWLDGLSGIARKVNDAAPLRDLLSNIATTTCKLTGYDFCAILLPNEQRTALLIVGSHGLRSEYVNEINTRRPMAIGLAEHGEAPSSRAFRYQRPVHVREIWEDDSCAPWETVAHGQGNRSLLSLPLITSRGTLGVLNCYTRQLRDFSGDDILFMETLANQAALAIETATLRSSERAQIDRLDGLNSELQEQQASMRRAEHAHYELMRLVLENHGLEDLASSLAEVTSSSVVVADAEGKPLAVSPSDTPAALRRYVSHAQAEGGGAVQDRGCEPFAETCRVPVNDWGAGLPGLAVPVLLDGEMVARLWSVKRRPGEMHSPAERRIVERATIMTALILSRRRVAQEAEWRVSRDLLDALLARGKRLEPKAVLDWGRRFGVDLGTPHVLLVVRLSEDDGTESVDGGEADAFYDFNTRVLLSRMQQVLKGASVQAVATARSSEVVGLVPVEMEHRSGRSPRELAHLLLRDLRQPGGPELSVAISPECARGKDYPGAYETARQALRLLAESGSGGRIVDARNLGVYRVLLDASDPGELARFAHDVLRPLEDHDASHRVGLVETLRTFLRSGSSTVAASAKLFVHPNTVRYRVNRIQELLGMSLSNEEDRLQVTLAMMIHDTCRAD